MAFHQKDFVVFNELIKVVYLLPNFCTRPVLPSKEGSILSSPSEGILFLGLWPIKQNCIHWQIFVAFNELIKVVYLLPNFCIRPVLPSKEGSTLSSPSEGILFLGLRPMKQNFIH